MLQKPITTLRLLDHAPQLTREVDLVLPEEGAAVHIDWSPETLRALHATELPGAEIIVVSNREPYIHNTLRDGRITVQTPASGLVAALEPVMRACGGTWVAHGSGSADRQTVDRFDRVMVPPSAPVYKLRRVWLEEGEQDGYYYGFSNEGIWPLCHIAFVRPEFRVPDWQAYVAVNQRFADAVAREATQEDPIVLVQDYHFALLPRMLREHLPKATIVTFWHIPWPNAECFGICPWREEIIHGLLSSTILGFHTRYHCNNFLESVDRFIESRIDRESSSVVSGGAEALVRAYPISIEWPPSELARQQSVDDCRKTVRTRFGLPANARLAVGVERLDYTKGIIERMRAIGQFLEDHGNTEEPFAFIQAAAPSRSKLPRYRQLQDEVVETARQLNAKFGKDGHQPIHLVLQHHEPADVFELFRAADVCIVSSLHDGMNLVAKEFAAARDDEAGVLILSSFAGAARELTEALIVNPYDELGVSEALHRALTMPLDEQRERMRQMRAQVHERNVYRWAGQMLLDAARVRRHQHIMAVTERSGFGK